MYWASGLWFKGRFSLEAFSNYDSLFYYVSNESEHSFMFSVAETDFSTMMIDQQGVLHINRVDRERPHVHVSCSPFTFVVEVGYRCYERNSKDCLQTGCMVPEMESGVQNCSRSPYTESTYFREAVAAFPGNGTVLDETGGRLSSADCHAEVGKKWLSRDYQ
ncbi:unnamed protein product [Microthlaspi erraticum]|uniref:Uncharacterized protein n=1 Tax=Microthlaspi erraticum TaxID=1685480 RepID=A0A6D2KX39_9BRAS|nr:unnamed protein product [Microthlaspi erraticum]